MLALLQLALVLALAWRLPSRLPPLRDFPDIPGRLFSLGVALFLVTAANLALYALVGWGALYDTLAWTFLAAAALYVWRGAPAPFAWRSAGMRGFVLLFALVVSRFAFGVIVDHEGTVWCNFNFVDTAFHLSIAQALLAAPHWPPVDLDMAPFPLKYHLLADFAVAHLARLGLTPLTALRILNLLSAAALVGAVWSACAHWLRLAPRWTLLAALLFLFLNPALLNVVHWLAFQPAYFNPANLFDGLLHYPYFNFEFSLYNLIEPQRGLLFSLPIMLLILHLATRPERNTGRLVLAFALICLLPLGHIAGFAVLALTLAPTLWRERTPFLAAWPRWTPFFALGLAQLGYLLYYGPPTLASFSGWDVAAQLPLGEFAAAPAFLRRALFWFFANGDFLFWGAVVGLAGFVLRRRPEGGAVRRFLTEWRWYFAATLALFLLINFYRYAAAWGDSNKFVIFLNLALALLIAIGAATLFPPRLAVVSRALWWFFFALCLASPLYDFARWVVVSPHPKIILFDKNTRPAADWLRAHTPPDAVVLTAAFTDAHWLTALAGRPTLAGIYSEWNPYLQPGRGEQIRRVYEEGAFALLPTLGVNYVVISDRERSRYHLSPRWTESPQARAALCYRNGDGPADHYAVLIFDARRLAAPAP